MVSPLTSTIIATSYITIVTILACVLFARSRTPLRLGSLVMAVLGLSISAVSIVYATGAVSSAVFWIHQFIAECVAVTWVVTTIIHLGYAFYPTTRHQIALWRAALASVILYDLIAIAELAYYCAVVWGAVGGNETNLPVAWVYWVRQVIKVLACTITIAYLFVYSCMFIYYITEPDKVFSVQAQSLDLCLRLIVCPIFSLPPPNPLLNYFEAKYGSAVNGNPNTMVEEGITNDPRPRRPPMLVSQRTGSSMRRNSDFMFDLPPFNPSSSPLSSYESRQDPLHQLSPLQESDEDRIQAMVGLGGKPIRMF
ncbi:hypothetical protein BGZ93_007672 [Podila epicladia]|nr:hypothetical protein BGZ92_000730 [Podila epicladia]KAG0100682.1 hypothetical protein BGZ93_007672 [Podila epicladia]